MSDVIKWPVIDIDGVLYPATWCDEKGWHVAEEDLEDEHHRHQ